MKYRFVSALAATAAAGALSLLTGCTEVGTTSSGGGSYNPVAYQPHNPNAVKVKVSLSKQQVYVMEGSKPLLVAATNIGIPAKPTPRGNFTIYSKVRQHRSGSYGFYKNGDTVVPAEAGHGHGQYIGYPLGFWCEFSPSYGFHQGYVWPNPRTHGCLRLHKNVAAKFFNLVKIGTPVNIAETQPEDATIGANVQRPTDYNDPDPPAAYTASDRVFDAPPGGGLTPY